MPAVQMPENLCVAIARADDTTFGLLHSRFHELWSLRMGTSLEDRLRYTPTTCFKTFPFPACLTPADTAHQQTEATAGGALIPAQIGDATLKSQAARIAEADAKALQKRTLTHLYNQRPAWLAMAHEALDAAVAAAYGWTDDSPQTSDDEILARH
ncbi:MAG: type IIL restriction-modification enzyme MmeI [Hydrogenophaga sp.]